MWIFAIVILVLIVLVILGSKPSPPKDYIRSVLPEKKEFKITNRKEAVGENIDDVKVLNDLNMRLANVSKAYSLSYDETRALAKIINRKNIDFDETVRIYARIKNKKINNLGQFDVNPVWAICKSMGIILTKEEVKAGFEGLKITTEKKEQEQKAKMEARKITNSQPAKSKKVHSKKDLIKEELDKLYIRLSEPGSFRYMEGFIMSSTTEFDSNRISVEQYKNKLEDLIKLLESKKIIDTKVNFMYLNFTIEKVKVDIVKKNLEDKLHISQNDNKQDVFKKFVEYLGNNAFAEHNLEALSKILDTSKSSIKRELNTFKKNYTQKLKNDKFEQELLGLSYSTNIEDIDQLDGYQFEDYLAKVFKSFGYDTEQTPYSGDNGADLILSDGIRKYAIQAKNYSGNVGNEAVQQIKAAKDFYKCDLALVVTNSYFTKQAQELAKGVDVILIDREKLINIVENGKISFIEYCA